MKVVVTGTRGIPHIQGGVETHCEELFPRLADKNVDVTIIRRTAYAKDSLPEYQGVRIIDIASPKKKAFEAIIHTTRAIFRAKKLKADILHIHAIGPALVIPLAKILGLKVVFTHHGPDYDREKWGKAAKMMLRLGERLGTKYADRVIVISEVIRNSLKEQYNRNDSCLIYNGVPAPQKATDTSYLTQLGIEPGKYIFAMGRFVPEKNFHQLIEAFSKADNLSGFQLIIAGDADIEDEYSLMLKKIAKDKHTVLTGFIKGEKLQTLLTHAHTFILPSSHEGLPISLLEAMSYDLPVIVSDIPANKEVNLPNSNYFKTGDIDALKDKLEEALSKEKPQRISYPMEQYNWDIIADKTLEVYRSIRLLL